jgi:hypothetical protein
MSLFIIILLGFTADTGNWIQKNLGATFSCEDLPIQTAEDIMVPAVTIDQSLTKLFQCMTLAYRLATFNEICNIVDINQ